MKWTALQCTMFSLPKFIGFDQQIYCCESECFLRCPVPISSLNAVGKERAVLLFYASFTTGKTRMRLHLISQAFAHLARHFKCAYMLATEASSREERLVQIVKASRLILPRGCGSHCILINKFTRCSTTLAGVKRRISSYSCCCC